MKRASVIKHSSMALLIALLATAAPAAFGVNKYLRIALPDDGFGSTTRGLTKVGAGTLGIVGSKNLVDGSTEAMYWRLDPDAAAPNGFRITATGFGGWACGLEYRRAWCLVPNLC